MPLAHGSLSICHVLQGQSDIGLTEAEEAVRLNPSDPMVGMFYAQALQAAGKFDEALEQLALVKRLSPGDAALGRLVTFEAITLFAMGRHSNAEKRAREAIAARPRNPTARFILVAALDALERQDEAHSAYQELIRLAPESSPNFIIQTYMCQPEVAQQFREALGRADWEG